MKRLDVLVHERVVGDLVHPGVVLVLGRQGAVDQQVGDLEEVGLLGQLLDRVAPVLQDALLAVDVGHGAAARGGVDEAGVVDGQAGLVVGGLDLPDVGGLDGAVEDRDVVLLSGAVVTDGERIGHAAQPSRRPRDAHPVSVHDCSGAGPGCPSLLGAAPFDRVATPRRGPGGRPPRQSGRSRQTVAAPPSVARPPIGHEREGYPCVRTARSPVTSSVRGTSSTPTDIVLGRLAVAGRQPAARQAQADLRPPHGHR